MLSVLDIILISLGALCVVIYTTLKVIQLVKYKKLTEQIFSETEDITWEQAKHQAYEVIYHKKNKKKTEEDVTYEE